MPAEAIRSFDTLLDLKEARKALLGISVDLVERPAIERSRNDIRRRHILEDAEPLHVA